MQRTNVNPWEWSKRFGFSQAVETDGAQKLVFCSGQTAIGADGAPPSTSDMREQLAIAVANLETVLAAADMAMADIVRVTVFTTDVDELVSSFATLTDAMPHLPALTLIGVSRLAYPELKVEIEASAAR
jgi:enamine deaminase RidA (YjgF/YER057c/UK114 family)